MKPRVFVSSTYYDLKHIRDRVEKFITNYGFEAILFESDKVTYEHGKRIDISVYNEVKLCHVMILIIGGRYGAPASDESAATIIKKYEEDYISITRREFETALELNIPIFVFIDKNVHAEYFTFKENQSLIEQLLSEESIFRFAHVDHPNVFKFIDTVRAIPFKTFEKVDEIENYLLNQFAGMFYLYLNSLQKKENNEKILNTISELNNISQRMNEMLNEVGKRILGNDPAYEEVISTQNEILLEFLVDKFLEFIRFKNLSFEATESQALLIANQFYHILESVTDSKKISSANYFYTPKWDDFKHKLIHDTNEFFKTKFESYIEIENIIGLGIFQLFHKTIKKVITDDDVKSIFVEKLASKIKDELEIPF